MAGKWTCTSFDAEMNLVDTLYGNYFVMSSKITAVGLGNRRKRMHLEGKSPVPAKGKQTEQDLHRDIGKESGKSI